MNVLNIGHKTMMCTKSKDTNIVLIVLRFYKIKQDQ